MADLRLELTQEAEQNIAQTLDTLIEAANEIAKASEQDFERLKSKKWYKRLWELVTYSRDNEKIQARGVANLAKLNEIIMKAIVFLSKQNENTAEMVYHSLEEIKALQSDVGNIYNSLDKVIETLICIKRGFKSETRFDELSDSSKDIICALVFKFAEENDFNNSETQQLLYTLKTNAHTASSDVEYDCVDNLDLDAQKVLYSILQAYTFLFENEFDEEENNEIFDYLSLSKKDKERQKTTIKKELNLLGAEGYIKLLDNNAEEYEFDDFITDEYIEFDEIPVEQEEKTLYDYSALKNLIKSYIDVDENGVSATFGQLITDVAKYGEYFAKVKAYDLSNEATICIFQAEKDLIFTAFFSIIYLYTY